VAVTGYGSAPGITVADSNVGNVYTALNQVTSGSSFCQFFYCANANAQTANVIKATFGASIPYNGIYIWEIAGASATPFDQQAGGHSSSSPVSSSAFTTVQPNEITLSAVFGATGTEFFSNDGSVLDAPSLAAYAGMQHKIVSSTQIGTTSSMAYAPSGSAVIAAATFKAAGGAYSISGNAGAAGATVSYSGTSSGSVTADGSGN